jgi:hypothetical protein
MGKKPLLTYKELVVANQVLFVALGKILGENEQLIVDFSNVTDPEFISTEQKFTVYKTKGRVRIDKVSNENYDIMSKQNATSTTLIH